MCRFITMTIFWFLGLVKDVDIVGIAECRRWNEMGRQYSRKYWICWDRLFGLVVLQLLSEIVTSCRFHSASISLCKFSSFVVLWELILLVWLMRFIMFDVHDIRGYPMATGEISKWFLQDNACACSIKWVWHLFRARWDVMQTVEDVSFRICLQIDLGLLARIIVVFVFLCPMLEADASFSLSLSITYHIYIYTHIDLWYHILHMAFKNYCCLVGRIAFSHEKNHPIR